MKIKKLNKKEIGSFVGTLSADFSELDFIKAFQDFQNLVAKKNLAPVKRMIGLKCPRCGRRLMFKEQKVLSLQHYIPPYSCTGGAYWEHQADAILCECGRFISIPEKERVYSSSQYPTPKAIYPKDYGVDWDSSFNPWDGKPIYKIFKE